MKYEYHFEEMNLQSGKKILIIGVEDKIDLVSDFLMFDIQGANPDYALKKIDKVLDSKSDFETLSGNQCNVEIKKDFTTITDMYSEEESSSTIETTELREFIVLWWEKVREYYKKNN
ncbi:MAG: hypothetical protein ACC608_00695 [Anaerofustis sp.]